MPFPVLLIGATPVGFGHDPRLTRPAANAAVGHADLDAPQFVGGQVVSLGLKSGVVTLVDNPKMAGLIPAQAKAMVAKATQDIIGGGKKIASN